jgi:SAM domain (Sterile alpha motif)
MEGPSVTSMSSDDSIHLLDRSPPDVGSPFVIFSLKMKHMSPFEALISPPILVPPLRKNQVAQKQDTRKRRTRKNLFLDPFVPPTKTPLPGRRTKKEARKGREGRRESKKERNAQMAVQLPPASVVMGWSVDDVVSWLKAAPGGALAAYSDVFEREEIDGEFLLGTDEKDLRESLKMPLGHARKITKAVANSLKMRDQEEDTGPAAPPVVPPPAAKTDQPQEVEAVAAPAHPDPLPQGKVDQSSVSLSSSALSSSPGMISDSDWDGTQEPLLGDIETQLNTLAPSGESDELHESKLRQLFRIEVCFGGLALSACLDFCLGVSPIALFFAFVSLCFCVCAKPHSNLAPLSLGDRRTDAAGFRGNRRRW